MNHPLRSISVAIAATLAAACAAPSIARQDAVTDHSTYVTDSGSVVHCISTESGRTYCGSAHMRYDIVGAPPTACVEGSTWGFDDRGVWVTGGCKADFRPVPVGAPVERSAYVTPSGNLVHCVATASGRTYCGSPHERYVISGEPSAGCVEGNTWGVDDRGAWVSEGCSADFAVVADRPAARVYQVDNARVVHCVSTENGKTYCGTEHTRYVIRGTENPACVEGRTWGVDDRGVWVTGGCNADFNAEN